MYACSPNLPEQPLSGSNLLNQPLLHDRYRILKILSQGGFGRTWLAADEWQPPFQCVVKQLLPAHSIHRQQVLTLFRQEAQQLAELGEEHSPIPKLLDTFEQDGESFIVQEWIDGWTLEQEVAGAVPFDEAEVRQVLQKLLPVLQYLHDRQIIHRDIKPANIIRCKSDRQLVLVDFGAAKQLTHISPIHIETMIGSVEYAAPEQIKGQAVFASDLYSLGVTCLYLLTQMSPFDLYDIVENDWKWQAYLPQPISSDLKAILCKLLQPAVRRRYQSAAAVLADLDRASVSTGAQPIPIETESANARTTKSPSSETVPSDLNLIASFIQTSRSISGATVYLPQTQNWYYLPGGINASGKGKSAFWGSPRLAAAAATLPAQETRLFANDITPHQMTSCNPRNSTNLLQRLWIYCSTLFSTQKKGEIDFVFSFILIFMLTCTGSMLMICFLFELEKRSLPLQTEPASALPSPDISIK